MPELNAKCQHGWPASCGLCAALERAMFARATDYAAYVDEARRVITTWPGAVLARVDRVWRSERRWSRYGYYRMRYVRATAPDGSKWYGQGSDDYDLVRLHRVRTLAEILAA